MVINCSRHNQLKFFSMKKLLITINMGLLSLSLMAQRGSIGPSELEISEIDWSMHSRYNVENFCSPTSRGLGYYNPGTHLYLDEYIHPRGYEITLKAEVKIKQSLNAK